MLNLVRSSIHRVLETKVGDRFLPVRLPKDLARRVNVMLGEPICSRAEIERRRTARERLAELRRTEGEGGGGGGASETTSRDAAPVMIYFEKDRNARTLARIQETLDSRGIQYTVLDVAGDETTKDFVMREARCKEDELPIVFVAAAPIGGYNELTQWDVSGKLHESVFGKPSPARA